MVTPATHKNLVLTDMQIKGSTTADEQSATAANDFNLSITGAIQGRPGLTLIEKAALAYIHKHPGCSNLGLETLLGFKVRGVEDLLNRLRSQGLVTQDGQGRARTHRLTFEVGPTTPPPYEPSESTQPHTPRGNNEIVKSHTPRGPLTALNSLEDT